MTNLRTVRLAGMTSLLLGLALTSVTVGAWGARAQETPDPTANNGTVKIHEGAEEPDPVTSDDPQVCTFHIHIFNFDAGQTVTYTISKQPDDGSEPVSGSITADDSGEGRDPATGVLSPQLPDGMYKLETDTTGLRAILPADKSKVFNVDCGSTTTTSTSSTTSSTSSTSSTTSTTRPPTSSSTTSTTSSTRPTPPTTRPGPPTTRPPRLPFTGTPSLPLLGLGIALIGLGVGLLAAPRRLLR